MPMRSASPCRQPGCAALVDSGGRCAKHRREEQANGRGWARGTTTERGYGTHWQKLRAVVLGEEPLCRECSRRGIVTPATLVDHILPKASNGSDARENLQPLCADCHKEKTIREDSGFAATIPKWIRPSAIPLTIVCGPPAAGKTSYVREHAQWNDLVIDLDAIIAMLSGGSNANGAGGRDHTEPGRATAAQGGRPRTPDGRSS
jgi:5-methylcytosine-specific restriction endonuclease McrA